MNHLRRSDLRGQTGSNCALEYLVEPLLAPALPDARQARMVGKTLVQPVADEPANRDVYLRFAHQSAIVHDPEQQAGKHQPKGHLRVDPWPAVVGAIAIRNLFAQPAEVENPIDPRQDVILGHQLLQRPGNEQLHLLAIFQTQHLVGLQR